MDMPVPEGGTVSRNIFLFRACVCVLRQLMLTAKRCSMPWFRFVHRLDHVRHSPLQKKDACSRLESATQTPKPATFKATCMLHSQEVVSKVSLRFPQKDGCGRPVRNRHIMDRLPLRFVSDVSESSSVPRDLVDDDSVHT